MNAQPQHMEALAKANRIRRQMGDAKRRIREGEMTAEELFDPGISGRIAVGDLLCQFPRWGPKRTRRFLDIVCSQNRMRRVEHLAVRRLTDRERVILTDAVGTTFPFRHNTPKGESDG